MNDYATLLVMSAFSLGATITIYHRFVIPKLVKDAVEHGERLGTHRATIAAGISRDLNKPKTGLGIKSLTSEQKTSHERTCLNVNPRSRY